MGQILFGGFVLVAIGIPILVAPRIVWWFFATFELRTPEAVEPSRARIFQWRLSGAVITLLGAASLVGAFSPGDDRAKLQAFAWSIIIGVPLVVAGLIIGWIVSYRNRQTSHEEDLPPDEPSGFSYLVGYIGIFAALAALLAMGSAMLATTSGPTPAERVAEEEAEKEQLMDDYLKEKNSVSLTRYPVVTALPDAEALALPKTIYANPFPLVITDQSSFVGSELTLAEADLALETPIGFRCTVTQLIVQETEQSVTVGLVVKNVRKEGSEEAQCILPNDRSTRFYLVDLAAPLAQREVLLYGGSEPISVR